MSFLKSATMSLSLPHGRYHLFLFQFARNNTGSKLLRIADNSRQWIQRWSGFLWDLLNLKASDDGHSE